MSLADYYSNMDYWQEYTCRACKHEFDERPIPLPNTKVKCPLCGHKMISGDVDCDTYVTRSDGSTEQVDYPQ